MGQPGAIHDAGLAPDDLSSRKPDIPGREGGANQVTEADRRLGRDTVMPRVRHPTEV